MNLPRSPLSLDPYLAHLPPTSCHLLSRVLTQGFPCSSGARVCWDILTCSFDGWMNILVREEGADRHMSITYELATQLHKTRWKVKKPKVSDDSPTMTPNMQCWEGTLDSLL